ncbi:MAG TPA: hypothetical protein PKC39_12070 [Ferruginibacter sp.]|nr:hypothetical protein [Ferruginibacter sp.]HMP21686.1 hypothetical protein [Ferruginibacter sp.]
MISSSTNLNGGVPLIVKINFRLYPQGSSTSLDGILLVFDQQYFNYIDNYDGLKINMPGENIAMLRNDTILGSESRQPVTESDTIQFLTWGLQQKTYRLDFIPQNIGPGLTAILIDSFANPSGEVIDLSAGRVSKEFTVTSDPRSGGLGFSRRFTLLLRPASTLPVHFMNIGVNKIGSYVQVKWKVAQETDVQYYEVERSADGRNFSSIGKIIPEGAQAYSWNDISPLAGYSFYRIKAKNAAGNIKYTNIAKIFSGNEAAGISVFPNPATGSSFNLQMIQKEKGRYTLSLLDVSGRIVYRGFAEHAGGNAVYTIDLLSALPGGSYNLVIAEPGKNSLSTQTLLFKSTK